MFYISTFINTAIDTMTIAAVPKTFGIKYGCLILGIIQTSDMISQILVLLVSRNNNVVMFVIGFLSSIVALVICFFFQETLDVQNLQKKRMVILADFGI